MKLIAYDHYSCLWIRNLIPAVLQVLIRVDRLILKDQPLLCNAKLCQICIHCLRLADILTRSFPAGKHCTRFRIVIQIAVRLPDPFLQIIRRFRAIHTRPQHDHIICSGIRLALAVADQYPLNDYKHKSAHTDYRKQSMVRPHRQMVSLSVKQIP